MIKFSKHLINNLSTFRSKYSLNIYEKLKLIQKTIKFGKSFIQMFDNVNKIQVLQHKLINVQTN